MMDLQTDEILLALERALSEAEVRPGDDPGLSTEELRGAWNVSESTVRQRLRILARAGKLEIGRKNAVSLDSKKIQIPVYRVKNT